MIATAWVGVLVKRLAVEATQCPLVFGEVTGYPIDEHTNACFVQAVDEVLEVVGLTESCGRCVVAGDLIAPGRAVGVLGQRHELDVREAEVLNVTDEIIGELTVRQAGTPGTHVQLVDAHRGSVLGGLGSLGNPVAVGPLERGVRND